MAKLKLTADNMLVEDGATGRHVASLKQSYDGGWSISSEPEPLADDLPAETVPTREDLVAALRAAGHEVSVAPSSREGAGH